MRRWIMRYPGDPAVLVVELTAEQFLALEPDRCIRISDGSGRNVTIIPLGDEIYCDFCNADPGHKLYLVDRRRAYCWECFQQYHLPHCTELR